jgi:hypothetical protein
MASEAMTLGLELETKLSVVVDLAVEDEVHRTRRIGHGLVAERGEVDDRESSVPKRNAGRVIHELPVIVGATMGNAQQAFG